MRLKSDEYFFLKLLLILYSLFKNHSSMKDPTPGERRGHSPGSAIA
jgi:hypothetical protein